MVWDVNDVAASTSRIWDSQECGVMYMTMGSDKCVAEAKYT